MSSVPALLMCFKVTEVGGGATGSAGSALGLLFGAAGTIALGGTARVLIGGLALERAETRPN